MVQTIIMSKKENEFTICLFFSRTKSHFDDGMIQPTYYGSFMSFLSLSSCDSLGC